MKQANYKKYPVGKWKEPSNYSNYDFQYPRQTSAQLPVPDPAIQSFWVFFSGMLFGASVLCSYFCS